MLNLIQTEALKQKRSFCSMLVWLAPVFTVILAVIIMRGYNLQDGSYNWWYVIILPGSFTMFTAFTTAGDRRKNRHGLFSVIPRKRALWLGKIVLCTLFLFASCFLFFITNVIGGLFFGSTLSLLQNSAASLLLFITFAWQAPLWMAVTEKAGSFTAILASLGCNFLLGTVFAAGKYWWLPFSIPARLMTPVIGVLPNGLHPEAGDPMLNPDVILPGTLIAIVLFFVCSQGTSLWFEHKEA